MKIDPVEIIKKYYDPDSFVFEVLLVHSEMVTAKALQLADRVTHLQPDLEFVEQAAMLHDIGIFMTDAPDIGCTGDAPYLMHGPLGRELLEKEGLPGHALVCDRHTGVGISRADIEGQNLPLPLRDMLPETLEEKIICFADTFYGKNPKRLRKEKSIEKIERKVRKYGESSVARLASFRGLFGV